MRLSWAGVDQADTVADVVNQRTYDAVISMRDERDWGQFHSPENLIKSIAIEAGELLECVQWGADVDDARVASELADVLTYCILLAESLALDLDEIVMSKLVETRRKYPVDRAKGRSQKYDAL